MGDRLCGDGGWVSFFGGSHFEGEGLARVFAVEAEGVLAGLEFDGAGDCPGGCFVGGVDDGGVVDS